MPIGTLTNSTQRQSAYGPGRQQPRRGGRETARKRRGREQQQPDDEHPSPAEKVARPAAQQQQSAEGQRVGIGDPLQTAAGESKCRLNVRQCHIHDRRVEHDHELGSRDDEQRHAEMAAAALGAGLAGSGKCRCHAIDAADLNPDRRPASEPSFICSPRVRRPPALLPGE
jgi:hypothetical protein